MGHLHLIATILKFSNFEIQQSLRVMQRSSKCGGVVQNVVAVNSDCKWCRSWIDGN